MQISRHRRETAVFVLKWEDIEKIHNELSTSLSSVTINSVCADELTRTFESIDELKTYRNSKKTEIKELEFMARDVPFGQRCSLSFRTNVQRNVTFSVDATEEVALRLNDFHEDLLDSLRPWYSWVAKFNWEFAILGSLVAFVAFAVIWQKATGQYREINIQATWAELSWELVAVGTAPWIVATILNYFKERLFPYGAFAIGDGVHRFNRLEVTRTVFAAGFFVSLAASGVMLIF